MPLDETEYSNKFGPKSMDPWVIVERLTNGKTYQVKDIVSGNERQVTREQVKVIGIPSTRKGGGQTWLRVFPHFGRIELRETVLGSPNEENVQALEELLQK